ncbi:PTS sugar transporter subunit IIB [Vibrio sp. DW001]|uniref:PTS sugar transporter subunit IIB n=1 Tax=Vibrio sp. DW001 TaxID=2912315 RepID=UPI0023AF2A0A|nr:PTS sugar transporter subunit IIB [Vibrio sp. DW001]WED25936.1 PTS sugar transporter subunit IIB [Vibrio sp. DW001]
MSIKVLCVCGAGLGSSFAIEMAANAVLEEMGIDADLDHTTVSEAVALDFDIMLTQKTFADSMREGMSQERVDKIIVLHRLTDKVEIREKITALLENNK